MLKLCDKHPEICYEDTITEVGCPLCVAHLAYVDTLCEERRTQTARLQTVTAALSLFLAVDDKDKRMSDQGQAMDGYTKLAHYESCIAAARVALAVAREWLGPDVLNRG